MVRTPKQTVQIWYRYEIFNFFTARISDQGYEWINGDQRQ